MSLEPPPDQYDERLRRESERWAKLADLRDKRTNWLDSPLIRARINQLITGNEELEWRDAVHHMFFPPERCGGRGLSLGCNDGGRDRPIVRSGICSTLDGYDISEGSIDIAHAAAEKQGLDIHYHVADVNTLELPADTYSLAVVGMALHHFQGLEHLFDQVHQSLLPDGIFVFDEFIGPTRFRWTDEQLQLANEMRAELPPDLRRLLDGRPAGEITRPDPVEFDRTDPFEAIRSSEIMPLVQDRFRILARRDYGGTVLQLVLGQVIACFDEERPEHAAILEDFWRREQAWIAEGRIPSDYTVVVAARQDADLSAFPRMP